MINALGLLEVDDMVAAMDATDTMLKVMNVRLLSHEVLDPGRLVLMVEGDLVAYRAALDAGSATAACTDHVISRKETGRPDDDTQWLVGDLKRQPKRPEQKSEVETEVRPEKIQDAPMTSESFAQLLTLLVLVRQGMAIGEVAAHFSWLPNEARSALEQLFSDGALHRRSSRYRLKN